ncbi:hypothetical protein NC651_027134 [Populus alba x Populus x berolinensis]|nr:hypothetical protein NC651_027134 [Populus alba x Populus x berolinensis]
MGDDLENCYLIGPTTPIVLELLKFSKRERDLTTQLAICKAQLNELGETSDDRLNVVPNELRSASVTDPNAKEHCSNCMAEKSQFDRRKILSGSSPCNPQYPSWRDDKEEDKFIKELGTTKDKFTTPNISSSELEERSSDTNLDKWEISGGTWPAKFDKFRFKCVKCKN